MKLAEYFLPNAFIPDLVAETRDEAIHEIVQAVQRAGVFPEESEDRIVAALIGREALGSTGIGGGIAVPHTRLPTATRACVTLAISRRGVDFAALDGEPVHLILTLLAPRTEPGAPSWNVRIGERLVRFLRDDPTMASLRACQTRQEMFDLIAEYDEQQGRGF